MAHRVRRPAQSQIQQRDIVMQLRIVGRHPQHGFVADDILGCHLPIHIAGERRAIAIVRRQKLKPQIAHLVLRSLAPGDARRRLLGIADVLRGVVERVFH